jgi:hypothetical protein
VIEFAIWVSAISVFCKVRATFTDSRLEFRSCISRLNFSASETCRFSFRGLTSFMELVALKKRQKQALAEMPKDQQLYLIAQLPDARCSHNKTKH